MKRVYIDFDSTLYDTGKIKKAMNDIIANGVCENRSSANKELVLEEIKQAKENGIKNLFVPKDNAVEAAVVEGIDVYGVDNIINRLGFNGNYLRKSDTIVIGLGNSVANSLVYGDIFSSKESENALDLIVSLHHTGFSVRNKSCILKL